jgi:hypothetical protein
MAVIMPHSAFIHVPKTGGTWCRTAIKRAKLPHFESGPNVKRMLSRTHATLRKALPTINQRDWRKGDTTKVKRFTFGFVRNPLDWLASRWADAIRKYGGVANHDHDHWFNAAFSHDFSTYVDGVIEIEPSVPSNAILGRLGFHKDGAVWVPDDCKIDFIGKQENLVDDFVKALHLAGEKFSEKRVRALPPQRVAGQLDRFKRQIVWTDKQRRAIYEANKQLFDDYGYSV